MYPSTAVSLWRRSPKSSSVHCRMSSQSTSVISRRSERRRLPSSSLNRLMRSGRWIGRTVASLVVAVRASSPLRIENSTTPAPEICEAFSAVATPPLACSCRAWHGRLDVDRELAVLDLLDVLHRVLLDDLGDGHLVGEKLLLRLLEDLRADGEEADLRLGAADEARRGGAAERHGERAGLRLDVHDLHQRVVVDRALAIRCGSPAPEGAPCGRTRPRADGRGCTSRRTPPSSPCPRTTRASA